MKLPARIVEGVLTGLIVAAIGAVAVYAWRRFSAVKFRATPATVTDTDIGTTTYWG